MESYSLVVHNLSNPEGGGEADRVSVITPWCVLYSGKFSWGKIFTDFVFLSLSVKILSAKIVPRHLCYV